MKPDIYILGLNYTGHDASASLVKNGQVVASAMEERFTRIKQDRTFPSNAIAFCLRYANIPVSRIDCVTFFVDPEENFKQKIHYFASHYPKTLPLFESFLVTAQKIQRVEKEIRDKLGYLGKIYFSRHHDAHIAKSFFLSPYKSAAALSIDGLGEIASTVLAKVENNKITTLKTINFPHSLGMLYNALTHYLGFNAISDPGKVMGLSSCGNPKTYLAKFHKIVKLKNDGTYEFDLSYFEYPYRRDIWISQKFIKEFGPRRLEGQKITQRHEDIAAALQAVVEETVLHLAKHLRKISKKEYLCLSGGVALNSVANGKLLQKGWFKDIFIPPATGDDGTSIGSALYYYYCVLNKKDRHPLESAYLGSEYSNGQILNAIKKFGLLNYKKSRDVCQSAARLLAENKILGWFQGRMEIGPRALGNRSILANPGLADVKDILNSRVKFREPFRPFAPSILENETKNWFEFDHPSPYMLFVFTVKKEKRPLIPGVTHVDGTGRLQTVSQKSNPKYHRLISQFHRLSGIPMVVNTSLNIKGEPIIESPEDAIKCFLGNGLDYLVMGDYIIAK